jgi:hypothetical protein
MADQDALLQAQIEATIEPNVRDDPLEYGGVGVGLMYWMAQAGQIVAPWWSKTRDQQLRRFWKNSDHLASAFWMIGTKMASVPFQVLPRDNSIKGHVKQADYYNTLLQEEIQFGAGWSEFWTPFYIDLWTMDNGAFAEVMGDGEPDGPIEGPVLGLRHLDSWRCSRTSNPLYPVVYQTTAGAKHKLHHSRVLSVAQQPSPSEEMYGVGHSWTTRAINIAQELVDITVYKQEKLGSRPPRQLLIGRGISTKEMSGALRLANEDMDNQGLTRFSKTALIGSKNPDIALDKVDLAGVPDGFDERTSIELGMYLIALAGGFPPRWLWPATSTGATKADAMYQHIAGTGGGASWHIQMMTRLLGGSPLGIKHSRGKVLPPFLKIVFDYQDDEQDRAQSEIRKTRASTRKENLAAGTMTVRIAREEMVTNGEIDLSQFREMELEDGRLPDGESVITLFVSDDPAYQELLDLEVEEPLLTIANDPEEMLVSIELAAIEAMYIATNSPNKPLATKANNALAALSLLKEAYEPLVAEAVQQDMEADAAAEEAAEENAEAPQTGGGQESAETPEEESPPEEGSEPFEDEEPEPDEDEVKDILTVIYMLKEEDPSLTEMEYYEVLDKSFNFGAKMGQVISGALARGAGGRFVNAAELSGLRDQLMQRIAARLRGALARRRGKKPLGDSPRSQIQSDRRERMAAFIAALRESATASKKPSGGGAKKKPKKPTEKKPSGGSGAKPKKDPEVEAKKKRAAKAREREGVLNGVSESLNVNREDLDALHAFLSAGKEGDTNGDLIPVSSPSPEQETRLVGEGLLEYDTSGQLVATGSARSLLAAARTNNQQRAQEAMGRARRLRQDKVERVEDYTSRADKETVKQEEMRADIEEVKSDLQEDLTEIDARLDSDQAKWDTAKSDLESRLSELESEESPDRDKIAAVKDSIREGEERMDDKRDDAEDRKTAAEDRAADREDSLNERIAKSESTAEDLRADAEKLATQVGLLTGDEDEETKEVRLKSAASFRSSIRAAIRGGWTGNLDTFGVADTIISAIHRELTNAWNEGALSCGIKEDELTPEEVQARETFINSQMLYVVDFAGVVTETGESHRESPRDPAYKLGPLMSRGEVWANRYQEAYTQAKVMACANKKLKWVLGPTEHCTSCLRLDGKVKRASFWSERGIIPRVAGATYLDCGGWKCQCDLVETEDSLSKGPLPNLP